MLPADLGCHSWVPGPHRHETQVSTPEDAGARVSGLLCEALERRMCRSWDWAGLYAASHLGGISSDCTVGQVPVMIPLPVSASLVAEGWGRDPFSRHSSRIRLPPTQALHLLGAVLFSQNRAGDKKPQGDLQIRDSRHPSTTLSSSLSWPQFCY